eukprot:5940584-Amphidinium_carterae.1
MQNYWPRGPPRPVRPTPWTPAAKRLRVSGEHSAHWLPAALPQLQGSIARAFHSEPPQSLRLATPAAVQPKLSFTYQRLAPPAHRRTAVDIRKGMVVEFELFDCQHRGWVHEVLPSGKAFAISEEAVGEIILEDDGSVREFRAAQLTFTGAWSEKVQDANESLPIPQEIMHKVVKHLEDSEVSVPVKTRWPVYDEDACMIDLGPARPVDIEAVAMMIVDH